MSHGGGIVQVAAFPGPPGISIALPNIGEVYRLTIARQDGGLKVRVIQRQTADTPGSPYEELTAGC